MRQKCSAENRSVWTPCAQMRSLEGAPSRETQTWNVCLRQIAVEPLLPADPGCRLDVVGAQAPSLRQDGINSAYGRTSFDQGQVVLRPQLGYRTGDVGTICRVIPDRHRYNRAVKD